MHAIWGRWVTHITWWLRNKRYFPQLSEAIPLIQHLFHQNQRWYLVKSASIVFIANIILDISPPEAIFERGFKRLSGLVEIKIPLDQTILSKVPLSILSWRIVKLYLCFKFSFSFPNLLTHCWFYSLAATQLCLSAFNS